jgi:NAD+ kinase
VLTGEYRYEERRMLHAEVQRDGATLADGDALNDVVVTKAAVSRIIELDVRVDGLFVSLFRADGLILCSPTGSTAYNLAAGGPIIHPRVDAFVLTPIAPHTLTNRPVVIPGSEVIEVRPLIGGTADEIFVTYDGQSGYPLEPGDKVRIRTAAQKLRLVKAPARSYFEVLREKLKWGER